MPLSCCGLLLAVGRAVGGVVAESRAGLMQVDQHARAFFGDPLERAANQQMAIAIRGAEHIAIDAAGMHANQHVGLAGDLAAHQRQMLLRHDGADIK